MAQSNVYSLNIVGYVNVSVTNGNLHLLSNPLKPSNGNYNINNTVKLADPGSSLSSLYQWNEGTQSWDVSTYFDGLGWFPDAPQAHGKGFFIQPSLTQTITFVGEVQTGTSTNAISSALALVGNKVPVAGNEPGAAVGNNLDTIYTWNSGASSWESVTYFTGLGWFGGTATLDGPFLNVADGVFYQNTGATVQWIKTLNP